VELGTAGQYTFPADAVGRRSAAAEDAGWASLWWPDSQMGYHPTPPGESASPHETYDWAPMIGAAAGATRRVRLGVAVTDPFRRHPALLAQTAQTAHDLSRGRFVLGIGLGAGNNLGPIGLSGSSRIAALEEAVDIMRLLWSTTDPVEWDGEFWRLEGAVSGIDSSHYGPPPVWIAGAGRQSLELTGRKADGWVPVMMPAEMYSERLAVLRATAHEAGRDQAAITAGCLFLTIAADSTEACRELLDTPWVRALPLFQPSSLFRYYGYEHPLGEGSSGVRDFVPTRMSPGEYESLVERIPRDLIERLVLWGDRARLVHELQRYAEAGVQHAVVWNVTGMGRAQPGAVRTSYAVLASVRDELGTGG
jgi:phthiodiolone/phenolphthiodiolone dimycocerosates ketoreductase